MQPERFGRQQNRDSYIKTAEVPKGRPNVAQDAVLGGTALAVRHRCNYDWALESA